jgi:hypothetical protein
LLSIIVFSILLAGWTFNVKPQYWFSTPLNSYGDGQLLEFLLQNQFLNGSTLFGIDKISNIGWPGGTYLELYPQNDELFVFIISIFYKLFNLTIPVSVMALVLLKFPLASVSFYVLIRILGTSRIISAISSVAFAFIPYSLIRAEGHLMLAQIWVIPLATALPFYLFLKIANESVHLTKKLSLFALAMFSGLITGLAGSYYFVFSIILTLSFLLFDMSNAVSLTSIEREAQHQLTLKATRRRNLSIFVANKFSIYVLYFLISCFSFFITSFDNLAAEKSISNIFLIRDSRVPVESLIYSGNLLSLFSDLYYFIDKITQLNLTSIASQYYSWESSGIGPYASILLFVVLSVILYRNFYPNLDVSLPSKKLFFPLLLLLLFFFQGLGGFIVAEFLTPSLRAWGRISIYIAFLSLIILVLFINKLLKLRYELLKSGRIFLISMSISLIYFLLWNFLYIKDYNFHRISRETIVSTFENEKQYNDEIIQSLRTNLTLGCPIVVLPVYRFPEYDTPLDRLADSDLLSLSLADTSAEFKWNSGNVKWSEGDEYWAPLAVDIPPFASTSFETQVGYANEYGACAIALNQGMFDSEKNEVSAEILTSLNCPLIINQEGTSASNSWLIWDIRGNECSQNIDKLSALDINSFPKNNEKPVLWRYTAISPEYFEKNVGIFSGRSDVALDFIIEKNQFKNSKPSLKLGILNGELTESYNLQVCITSYQKVEVPSNCQNVKIANDKTVELKLTEYMNSTKYKVDIIPSKLTSEFNWSLLWTYDQSQ